MNECKHEILREDRFSKLSWVKRHTPGDCVCADCGEAVTAWWRDCEVIPAEETEQIRARSSASSAPQVD